MEEKMDTHSVKFFGFFDSMNNVPFVQGDYEDVENRKARMDRESKQYIEVINNFDKTNVNIIDFGGGCGGHYLTLKENTTKNFNYQVVELPRSFTKVSEEVKYYPSVELAVYDSPEGIDCLYSNATIFLTKGTSAPENIYEFCKTFTDYIFLQRTIICEGENYNHFYTYEPTGKTYFSIISEKHLIEICDSCGYELVFKKPIFTKFIVNSVRTNNFEFKVPEDLGTVCYKDFLFKKKEV